MKILAKDEPWPVEPRLNVATGAWRDEPVSPLGLVMKASHEIMKHTMLEGTHIICHPKYRVMFSVALEDYHRFQPAIKMGEPDKWAGMEIIWSTQHGLEVLCDGVVK